MNSPIGVKADRSYSYRHLENIARNVREVLGVSPDEAIDPLKLFEDLHEISISDGGRSIPLWGSVLPLEGSEGYSKYDSARGFVEIIASETTYSRLEQSHPRSAYFISHELGHCILHTGQLVRLAQLPTAQQAAFHRGKNEHKVFEDTEWQANAFASSLLMPAEGLACMEKSGNLTTVLVSARYKVSSEAASYRLGLFNRRKGELTNF